MAHERVIVLLNSHKVRIVRALVRQMRALSPRYASVEQHALEASLQRLMGLVTRYLQTGDDGSIREYTLHTAQLRQALGFKADDFMLAGLSWLPVMRRFLVEQAPSVEQGLDDYEAFEAVAIPLLAQSVILFRSAGDEFDDADEATLPNARPQPGRLSLFSIERVTGSAEDEFTPFG